MKHLILFLVLIPALAWSQDRPFGSIEIFGGLSFNRPFGLESSISYQSGNAVEAGGRYNRNLGRRKALYLELGLSYVVYNIEGYFDRINGEDRFVRTPDNVKSNALQQTPVSLGVGIQKLTGESGVWALGLHALVTGSAERRYKIGNDVFEADYSFRRKLHFSVNGSLGLFFSSKSRARLDLVAGYVFTSYPGNNSFNPLKLGFRFGGALKR